MGKAKKKAAEKSKKPATKKVTAASVVLEKFKLKKIPSDKEIIAAVRKAVKGSKFDENHLAWYKSRARKGDLAGLDKPIDIPKKATKAKPVTKKKVAAKKKKKKSRK